MILFRKPALYTLIIITVLVISCQRNTEITTGPSENSHRSVTIHESKKYYSQRETQFFTYSSGWTGIELAWDAATETQLNDLSDIVMVPIVDSAFMFNPLQDAYFVFFEDTSSNIQMHMVVFQADTSVYGINGPLPVLSNFTGNIYEFLDEQNNYISYRAVNGNITGCGCSEIFDEFIGSEIQPRHKIGCYKWGDGAVGNAGEFFVNIWSNVKKFFGGLLGGGSGSGGNGGGTPSPGDGWVYTGGSGNDGSFGFGGTATGGNGAPSTPFLYNVGVIFSEFELKKINKVASWLNNKYDAEYNVQDVIDNIPEECIWLISNHINHANVPTMGDDSPPACALTYLIADILDLTESESECILNIPSALEELYSVIQNENVIAVCNSYLSTNNLLKEAISSVCQGNTINNIADIYNALPDDENIVVLGTINSHCPKYACMLKEIIENQANGDFLCSWLSEFEGDNGTPLYFQAFQFGAYDNNYNPQAEALTFYDNEHGHAVININSIKCNANNLTPAMIFETLQHELIHAELYRRLYEEYNWNGASTTFEQAFYLVVNEKYGPNPEVAHHRYILEELLDEMVNSLIGLNNNIGTYNDFVGLVLIGIPPNLYQYINLTTQDVNELYFDYETFLSNHPLNNINTIYNHCNE